MLALLVAAFLTAACAPPESNGITNSPPLPSPLKSPPKLPKQITGRAFNGNTITYYTLDTAAQAALTPQSIGITDISGDVKYTIEQVGRSGQVGYIADTSAIKPNEANPNTLDIPQGTTGFFTVQVSAKNAKRDAAMPSKKVLIAAGRIDVGAKLAMPEAPTLGTPASKKENTTVDSAVKKVRITALEAATTFTVVPPPQFPAEAPKYTLTYIAEGVGDNNIVKAIDPTTGEITQGDVGSGDNITAIKARTADITVKVSAEAVGPYPALQDTTLFTVEHYRWMRVASGAYHTLAINSRGELYAWGSNKNGQLGIGTTTDNELAPQRVGNDSDWEAISGGEYHSLALKSDSTIYSWGANSVGQLGNGENGADFADISKDKTAPIQIGTDRDWRTISAGSSHSLAIKTDNTLHVWGNNATGQLGLGDTTDKNSPTRVSTGWKTVSAGFAHSLALKNDNTLYAWGWNWKGQVGNGKSGSTSEKETTPQKISAETNWNGIAAGYLHSLVFKNNGEIYAWGDNSDYQLGDGTFMNRSGLTKVKSDDTDWKAIGAGEIYSLALKTNGTLYTWGDKSKIGIITNEDKSPTPVPHP